MREIVRSLRDVDDVAQGDETTEPPTPSAVERGEFVVIDADSGLPVLTQRRLDVDLSTLRRGLGTIKYEGLTSEGRMSGLRYAFRTFGYRTRSPLRRRETCSACNTSAEYPDVHRCIVDLAPHLEAVFADFRPDEYERQSDLVDDAIHPDWRINGGLWTSGIINQTAALTYHTDRNNLPSTWSAMVVVRRHIRGGHLHVPALDLYASCDDGTVLLFEGAKVLHGVTKFRIRPGGYRYSLVFYTLAGMKRCLPLVDEIADGARNRAEREMLQAADVEARGDDG